VTHPADRADVWGDVEHRQLATVARNVSTRYLAILIDAIIGLLLLPFNVRALGPSAYGLWMLTASMTTYFSVLDLGFAGSTVRFVAHYRAKRDASGLNEIASTLFGIFSVTGCVAYAVFLLLAFNIEHIVRAPADQATARSLLLIIGVYVSLGFPFAIFGGIINGFQRYDVNNLVGICSIMLVAGFNLVELVTATTTVRIVTYCVYRLNAYRVFPALTLRPSLFQWSRVREITGFSVYASITDWSNKLNYSLDAIIIGMYLSTAAVTLWTVPQRLAEVLQRLTNQLNGVLFPVVVHSAAGQRPDRLRAIFVQGTRLSLVGVVPLATALVLLAAPLIHVWVGPRFNRSVVVAQILIGVVAVRVGCATATTVLKGAGQHRVLAFSNAGAAIANVALSLLWIRRFGLIGQALGTLLPIAFTSICILWPIACRRVGLTCAEAFRLAVWPALWPITVMAVVVVPLRDALPARLWSVALIGAVGVLCYATIFLAFAVKQDERRTYIARVSELARARLRVAAAA
jgi:O-antigen/teichoic acid export membrane protein